MPRKPQVRYFDSRQAYYTQWHGKQVKLASGPKDEPSGETYLKALDAFRHLMEKGTLETAGDANTVRAVCEAYMRAKDGEVRASTMTMKLDKLRVFVAKYGDVPVEQLKPYHAEDIITEQRKQRTVRIVRNGKSIVRSVGWCNSSVRLFIAQLKACFNWAFNNELITRNPFKALTKPKVSFKSRERIVSAEAHAKVLRFLRKPRQQPLRRLIIALENTGARQGELIRSRVSDFDSERGCIVLHKDEHRRQGEHAHKTSGKGKTRFIHFTGEALTMVKALCQNKKPTDFIFVNGKGKPYTATSVDNGFAYLQERLNQPHYCPHAYRHTFATNWLKKSKSIDTLSALFGTSPAVIREHYSHLIHEHDALRSELEDFRQQEQRRQQELIEALERQALDTTSQVAK